MCPFITLPNLPGSKVILPTFQFVTPSYKEMPNQFVADNQIAEKLGLDIEDAQMHLDILEEGGFVKQAKTFGGSAALLTSQGRLKAQE